MKIIKNQFRAHLWVFLTAFLNFHTHAEEVVHIAAQGNYFTLAAQAKIKYGANDTFNLRILQPGTYFCSDSFFGSPIQNIAKACYEVTNPDSIEKISMQFSEFQILKNGIVFYGANGSFFQRPLAAGQYLCSDKLFGDPIFGVVKACYMKSSEVAQVAKAAQTTQAKLTSQYGSFNLSKLTTVTYGANGSFFNKTLPSGTYSCDDKLFGDPAFGVIKACYASESSAVSVTLNKPVSQSSYPDCQD